MTPAAPGRRRVVLATNVAESSLTLPGVRAVVDTGLAREPRFDPNAGFTRLDTVAISMASATQRAGRAGRLGPGYALRLWSPDKRLESERRAEIVDADLAPLALELAAWGGADLRFLDTPPPGHLAQARELLQNLGALDAELRINAHGRELIRIGTHPRLANLVVHGRRDAAAGWVARVAGAAGSARSARRRGALVGRLARTAERADRDAPAAPAGQRVDGRVARDRLCRARMASTPAPARCARRADHACAGRSADPRLSRSHRAAGQGRALPVGRRPRRGPASGIAIDRRTLAGDQRSDGRGRRCAHRPRRALRCRSAATALPGALPDGARTRLRQRQTGRHPARREALRRDRAGSPRGAGQRSRKPCAAR